MAKESDHVLKLKKFSILMWKHFKSFKQNLTEAKEQKYYQQNILTVSIDFKSIHAVEKNVPQLTFIFIHLHLAYMTWLDKYWYICVNSI